MLGTSKQVVSRYELGQTTPKIGVAARWCELLGVNLDNMLNNNRDSMYPLYMDGDRVLVLKAPTLQHSGDIGVVRYDGEMATLKKVEYADGEDWVRLVAINPNYPPHMITGCDLEQCSILGIPKLILRET